MRAVTERILIRSPSGRLLRLQLACRLTSLRWWKLVFLLDTDQSLVVDAPFTEAQRMAGHSDTRTTGLYDRRNQKFTRGEVEKISILG